MKKIKHIFITLGIATILFISLEFGFYLRDNKKNFLEQHSSAENKSILIIGDSVVGNTESLSSIASNFKNKLIIKINNNLIFNNLSEPALSSWKLDQKIESYLTQYKPSIVVIMLGNSDYVIRKDSEKVVDSFFEKSSSFFLTFRSISFLKNILFDKMTKKNMSKVQRGRELDSISNRLESKNSNSHELFWKYTKENNYLLALENFEKILKKSDPNIRAILQAQTIYIQLEMKSRGAAALLEYSERTNNKYLANVANQVSVHLNDYKNTKNEYISNREISDRNSYLSQLKYYKKMGLDSQANNLFKNLDKVPIYADHLPDFVSLNNVARKILQKNVTVFLVQYPNQLVWPLELADVKGSLGLHFIDLHNFLISQLENYSVNQLFEDDFLHLTNLGAALVADKMSQSVFEIIEKEKNEK